MALAGPAGAGVSSLRRYSRHHAPLPVRPPVAARPVVLTLAHAELPETDWLELMPPADRKALEEMPDIIHDTPEAAGTFTSKGA